MDGTLAQAIAALDAGQPRRSVAFSHAVLEHAQSKRDPHLEARASLLLAQGFQLGSRLRLAADYGARAADLFHARSDAEGLADALSLRSYCASAFGRHDEALLLATRGIEVRAAQKGPQPDAMGLNYFGVASLWAGDLASARGVLDAAALYAVEEGCAAAAFQPVVNAACAEVLRLMREGEQDTGQLAALLGWARQLLRRGARGSSRGSADIVMLLLSFCDFMLAQRRGEAERAAMLHLDCIQRAARLPRRSWLHAFAWWARYERSKSAGDTAGALRSTRAMAAAAREGEHATLAALADDLGARLSLCR